MGDAVIEKIESYLISFMQSTQPGALSFTQDRRPGEIVIGAALFKVRVHSGGNDPCAVDSRRVTQLALEDSYLQRPNILNLTRGELAHRLVMQGQEFGGHPRTCMMAPCGSWQEALTQGLADFVKMYGAENVAVTLDKVTEQVT